MILAGSIVTMGYPMLRGDMHPRLENLRPFTPLELAGRDVYQREGCSNCHTQTVRPLRSEVLRYGEYSKAGEFAYDRPFLWGSKRTGPDLAREGGKRPDGWHQRHYENPQAFEPRSNMPSYAFLKAARLEPAEVRSHYLALAAFHPEMKAGQGDFAAPVSRKAMVQRKEGVLRTSSGQERKFRAIVSFLRPVAVSPRDRITLWDGLTGQILEPEGGLSNPSTGAPYVRTVHLG